MFFYFLQFSFAVFVNSDSTYFSRNKITCTGRCGDIKLNFCLFQDLVSQNEGTYDGGAILILQNCEFKVEQCIFDGCIAERSGGAAYVCSGYDNWPNVFISDYMIERSTVQNCCFQNCYCFNNDRTCSVFVLSSEEINFKYSNTVKCPGSEKQMRTGQICIISDKLFTAEYLNLTQGNSIYCAGIEIFNVTNMNFRFNSFCNMVGSFLIYYHLFFMDSEMSYCNFIEDTIIDIHTHDFSPAVIYVGKQNFLIQDCIFYHIHLIETAIIATYDYVYHEEPQTVTVANCYADSIYGPQVFMTMINCSFQIPYEEITYYNFDNYQCGQYKIYTETPTLPEKFIPIYSKSLVEISLKSATSTFQRSNSYSLVKSFDKEANTYIDVYSNVYTHSLSFHIITYYTHSDILIMFTKTNPPKSKSKQALLIGGVCGAIAILFLLIYMGIFIYRKINYGYFFSYDVISDNLSYSSDEHDVELKRNVNLNIDGNNGNCEDNWI